MQGSTYKRCPCPSRRDARGRRLTCGKSHGSWSYKVDVPTDDGSRHQVAKGGFATKRDAEQAMAEIVAKAARGPVITISRQRFGDYLTEWLAVIKPTLSPAAWTNYRTCIDRYVRPWLSAVPLGQLTGAVLTRHYAMLLERGGHAGRPLSPTTVRTVHRVMSKAIGDAVRDELLEHNPVSRAVPPKRRRLERLERSDSSTVRDGHRAWGLPTARPPAPSRRPPYRRAPAQALQGLVRLEQLSRARAEIDAEIIEQVRAVVALGTDWGSVGRALGVTRQAARQRYGSEGR